MTVDFPAIPEFQKLTIKQKRFVAGYCVHFNATRAAKEAGYSEKTAYSIGHNLLMNVEIKAAIKAFSEQIMSTDETTLDLRILLELKSIAFEEGHAEDEYIYDKNGEKIGIIKRDRLNALKMLGEYRELFTKKIHHSGEVTIIKDDIN